MSNIPQQINIPVEWSAARIELTRILSRHAYGINGLYGILSYTEMRRGAAAAVGDGGTIAHGMGATPTEVQVQASVAGEMVSVTSIDAANITVAIKTHAGAAGSAQTIYWSASR